MFVYLLKLNITIKHKIQFTLMTKNVIFNTNSSKILYKNLFGAFNILPLRLKPQISMFEVSRFIHSRPQK